MQNMAKRDFVVARPWQAARRWRNANSWLQDLETLLERTRNAARGRRNANSCSQDRQALLEDLVVAEWQLPDSTLRACWNITRDHRARLVWSNRDFFGILQIYLQYLLSYILKFLLCIYAGNPRVYIETKATGLCFLSVFILITILPTKSKKCEATTIDKGSFPLDQTFQDELELK